MQGIIGFLSQFPAELLVLLALVVVLLVASAVASTGLEFWRRKL